MPRNREIQRANKKKYRAEDRLDGSPVVNNGRGIYGPTAYAAIANITREQQQTRKRG